MFKTLASCATLGLLALTTSAAPLEGTQGAPKIVDLSPRITKERIIFINTNIDFTQPAKVFDDTGSVVHMIQPLSTSGENFTDIVSATDPLDVARIRVRKPSNCSAISTSYFFHQNLTDTYTKNPPRGQWLLEDANHHAHVFDQVFVRSPKGAPVGEIQAGPTMPIMVAKISYYPNPPATIPAGHYYSIYFPADQGHDPFIGETDAIVLVVKILQDQKQCA
ncbi:secreted protein [Melampsora americana]|nr:secreted protein [Melampsora americana]KAH9819718.1 secreted protein [Melampsora americana]